MKRRFRTNLKPRTETKMLAVKSAHPNGMVSSTDSHRSSMGILKGKLQHTLSVAPSLLYYFSQYCGISFDESAELLKAGRLYAGGKPLQGLQALTVQVPMSIIPQLDLEVVTLDGHLVPAAQRQFHRYYGFMNLGSSTTVTTDEKEPRSFIFRVRKLSPTPLPPPRWTAPSVARYSALREAKCIIRAAELLRRWPRHTVKPDAGHFARDVKGRQGTHDFNQ
jgi:hypothetical protein